MKQRFTVCNAEPTDIPSIPEREECPECFGEGFLVGTRLDYRGEPEDDIVSCHVCQHDDDGHLDVETIERADLFLINPPSPIDLMRVFADEILGPVNTNRKAS